MMKRQMAAINNLAAFPSAALENFQNLQVKKNWTRIAAELMSLLWDLGDHRQNTLTNCRKQWLQVGRQREKILVPFRKYRNPPVSD
jgi:hypothetical protein